MAKFTRLEVLSEMIKSGLIPIFYNKDIEVCKQVIKACYDGGVRVFEFTNRGDYAHVVFAELFKYVEDELPDLILGAGSVVDVPTSAIYIQLGSHFIVSPVLNKKMAKLCNRRKIVWIPGCGSLTEISYAEELGAEIVKIFPAAQLGGPGFVKAIKAPCPWTSIMPTGGVDISEENLKAWFTAGVVCAGIGSKLITKEILNKKDYLSLTAIVKNTLKIIKETKQL